MYFADDTLNQLLKKELTIRKQIEKHEHERNKLFGQALNESKKRKPDVVKYKKLKELAEHQYDEEEALYERLSLVHVEIKRIQQNLINPIERPSQQQPVVIDRPRSISKRSRVPSGMTLEYSTDPHLSTKKNVEKQLEPELEHERDEYIRRNKPKGKETPIGSFQKVDKELDWDHENFKKQQAEQYALMNKKQSEQREEILSRPSTPNALPGPSRRSSQYPYLDSKRSTHVGKQSTSSQIATRYNYYDEVPSLRDTASYFYRKKTLERDLHKQQLADEETELLKAQQEQMGMYGTPAGATRSTFDTKNRVGESWRK